SDTVMGAAIQKEDVLPDAMIRDVMVASPESAKDDALLEKLNQRTNPPPAYMLAQILQGRSLVSVYGDLLAKQSYHNNRKAFATKILERLYVTDTINPSAQDSLIKLLQSLESMRSQVQLAFLYLKQHDSALVVNTLAAIPVNYALNEQQFQEHELLTAYLNHLQAMQENLPDSTQTAWLMNAAQEGNSLAGTYARNLLLGLGWISYNEPIILPHSSKSSLWDDYRNLDPTRSAINQLEVYPNPASDYIIVKWTLDRPPAGLTLKVTTIDGKLIREISISGTTGETVISTDRLLPGIYLVSVHDGIKVFESKKVSIQKH
ncbi:MAG: T9SS type A sorting domain-containing protein, partial [Bacteroidales bacterium]|nr:T9SS type A sorting domain-containing protein [Bacteroidales bacterium]